MKYPIRINKYLAEKGYATRRGADILIQNKSVRINNRIAKIGELVNESDVVHVEKNATDEPRVYLAYHKPYGVITQGGDEGSVTVASQLIKHYKRDDVFPVGRLEKDTAGLIILTNDGRITDRLLSPKYAHEREYVVTVDKRMFSGVLKKLEKGVRIEKEVTKPAHVQRITPTVFRIALTEGKKHQIKRMCAALGYQVTRVVRTRILNIDIGNTKPGQYRTIKGKELADFLDALHISK